MEKIDDQSLDVRPVLILVSHDQKFTVAEAAQFGDIRVLLAVVQSQNLDYVSDLFIVHQLCS